MRNIKHLAAQYANRDEGQLAIATTHTQARVCREWSRNSAKAFPKVHLALHQGSPAETLALLLEGKADIGIATNAP